MLNNKLKQFFSNRKEEIREEGLFYCLFLWFFIVLSFFLMSPFLLVYLFFTWLNDCSKKWFK